MTMPETSKISSDQKWRVQWDSVSHGSEEYGKLFFDRATGQAAEMESSKAAARRVARYLQPGQDVLDVGCGAGHYLRSLRAQIPFAFAYRGIDATPRYVELARQAFAHDPGARFDIGDIFNLDMPDRAHDLTLCANVLLHLPSVAKPLSELVRVTRRRLVVRTLVSDASYIVKRVTPDPDGVEFDESGEPVSFHYLNIYSEAFLRHVFSKMPRVAAVSIETDRDFDPSRVSDSKELLNAGRWNATDVSDGMQRSGMLMMPWCWIDVELGD